MPRPLRVHVDGALCYVTSRSIAPHLLFRDERDYQTYLELLQEYRQKYGFKLYGYVLFPDHLHLCLEPSTGTTISAIMHALSSRYTKYFNRRHRHAGHLFQERFKSTLIEKVPSLLRLTAYLHLYPLRMGAVNDVQEYRWTSYTAYCISDMQEVLISDISKEEVLERLGQEYPGLTYEQYVMSMAEPEWQQLHDELQQRVIGSPSFVSLVEQRLKAPSKLPANEPRPMPQPRPVVHSRPAAPVAPRFERQPSVILNGTFALAFVSLCAAGLYARNLDALKQTVQTLVHERMISANLEPETSGAISSRLASYHSPAQLSGVAVNVEWRAVTGSNPASQTDRLEFRRGQLVSQQLNAQGFAPSRYTVAKQDDGAVRWEAIQASPSGETVHWRGEWNGEVMRGVVTKEAPGQPAAQFTFIGSTPSQSQPRSET